MHITYIIKGVTGLFLKCNNTITFLYISQRYSLKDK